MKALLKILPWAFLALFGIEIVVVMMPKKEGELHVAEFGRLPALLNGRIQPLDSVARNSLLQIRSTGDVPMEFITNKMGAVEEFPGWKFWHHPKKLKSTEWLLEVFFKPEAADTRPVFLIHHPDLLNELKLADKGIDKSGLRYYTFKEIEPVLDEISAQGQKASAVKDEQRTAYDKQVLKLANAVFLYQRLKNSVEPEGTSDFARMIADFKTALLPGIAAFKAQQNGETSDKTALEKFVRAAQPFDQLASLAQPLIVPPPNPAEDRHAWKNIGVGILTAMQTGEVPPPAEFYARIADAYGRGDASEFNSAVAAYKQWLEPRFSREAEKGGAEFYFNRVKPFLHATIIYVFAFVLACGALLTFGTFSSASESFRRSAFYLVLLAFAVHTFGLVYRMVLEGRPPVTNLYSSAVFIGWAACLLGIILERVYRVGIGSAVASLIGFITLLIAHNLAIGGDTMEMMRAVLDTNFWLAWHVVTVTLGYASTFVAGLLAIAYIVLGVFTPLLTQDLSKGTASEGKANLNIGKVLVRMTYAIICFATLFSFVGTVLGGIWADQSWGRFWGWDPKENGALLIVMWNAIILHVRWGKLASDRGLMGLAVFGNVITSFSWFGVNMLGIGLHSYGFMDAAFKWLMLFILSQFAIIALGSLPLHMWKSFQGQNPPPASGTDGDRGQPSPAKA